jgi:hypothetical protein
MTDETKTKVCKKCGRELSIDDFYWQDKRQVKRRPICRYCVVERIMRNKKGDQTYQVKHLSHPVLVKRKNRVPNGQGERSEYYHKYYQQNKERLDNKNHADYIQRKLNISVERKPIHSTVPQIVANCPTCKDNCENYPCFAGIDNITSNLAMTCHGYKPREKK